MSVVSDLHVYEFLLGRALHPVTGRTYRTSGRMNSGGQFLSSASGNFSSAPTPFSGG